MKIVYKYVLKNIIKTSLLTLLICTFFIIAVELFMKTNDFITNEIPIIQILYLSFLAIPKYINMVASISFLFGTTYTLSQLYANNEMIILYNIGFSFKRLMMPIVILAIIVSFLFFLFTEKVAIDMNIKHGKLSTELFGQSSTTDNQNITLTSIDGDYIIRSSFYDSDSKTLSDVIVVENSNAKIIKRIDSSLAKWNGESWTFYEANIYEYDHDINKIKSSYHLSYDDININLAPKLFEENSLSISTMDLSLAKEYVENIKKIDIDHYYTLITDFYTRLTSSLSIFILIIISIFMNYNFKKNILLFSILQSLIITVVFYVTQMLANVLSKENIIVPEFAIITPIILVFISLIILKLIGKKV